MTETTHNRKGALRSILVARVSSPDAARKRPWRLGALIAAVAIAGAAAGAGSATAVSKSEPYPDNVIASLALSAARANSVAVGEASYVTSEVKTTVVLGKIPTGATGVAVMTRCLEPGSYDILMDGEHTAGVSCDEGNPTSGMSWVESVREAGTHTLTFDSSTKTGYEAFVVWVTEPPLPPTSRQQKAELADGTVTREEYVSAFSRFVGCMGAAGFDVLGDVTDDTVFDYAIIDEAHRDGADELCYVSQFQDVDMAWQIQNEATSESTRILHDCLVANGITPSENYLDYWPQLQAAGIEIENCG